jgi:DNA-binding transcriptional ArsR family regulator
MTGNQKGDLSQDALFSLLSNPRRRFILQHLKGVGEGIELQDLAAEVAAWENETDRDALTDKQRKRLYVSLYQTHIPKLEEAGIVEYDDDSGEIRLTERGSDVNRYLDADAPDAVGERHWGRYYLLIAVVGAAAYGAAAVVEGPWGPIGLTVIGVAWALLAGTAVYHYLETERDGD